MLYGFLRHEVACFRHTLFEDRRRSPSQHWEDDALLQAIAPQKEPTPGTRIELITRILYLGCCALVLNAFHRPTPNGRKSSQIKSPVLIGAYGGEHVGDTAILGGCYSTFTRAIAREESCLAAFAQLIVSAWFTASMYRWRFKSFTTQTTAPKGNFATPGSSLHHRPDRSRPLRDLAQSFSG